MITHRETTDVQTLRYFLVCVALHEPIKHIHFPASQLQSINSKPPNSTQTTINTFPTQTKTPRHNIT